MHRPSRPAGCRRLLGLVAGILVAVLVQPAEPARADPVADGTSAISHTWAAHGGAGGVLGAATSAVDCTLPRTGCTQSFAHGSLYWFPLLVTNASAVFDDDLGTEWTARGGVTGPLGYPTEFGSVCPTGSTGCLQRFEGGTLTADGTAGTHLLPRQVQAGGGQFPRLWASTAEYDLPGLMGWPTDEVSCAYREGGCIQHFERGAVYLTGDHLVSTIVDGPLADVWRTTGAQDGPLGYPVSSMDPMQCLQYECFVFFENGPIIAYSPSHGAHVVSGAVMDQWFDRTHPGGGIGPPTSDSNCDDTGCSQAFLLGVIDGTRTTAFALYDGGLAEWIALGGSSGALGHPVTNQYPTTGSGSSQLFQHGGIHSSPATGTRSVIGPLALAYDALRGESGPLGYPVTEQYPTAGGGASQVFQSGGIHWSPATGAHAVLGGIAGTYDSMRGESGPLGYPVSDQYPTRGGGTTQLFQNGGIHASPATGTHAVIRPLAAAYDASRGESGMLGYPVGEQFCGLKGGGCGQHFQGGSAYWSPATGPHLVPTPIRAYWAAHGWEAGSLGYPTTDRVPTATGWRQWFQHGSVVWNVRTGVVTRG